MFRQRISAEVILVVALSAAPALSQIGVENLTKEDYREQFEFSSAVGQSVRRPGVNFYFGSQFTY